MAETGRHRIIRLTETGSTNKDAMRLALQGEPLPLWVKAERQSAGRGRQGRGWESLPGNLHASIAFSSGVRPELAGQLSLVAGLMFFDAVARTTELHRQGLLRLKWPNDLMIGHAKLGGILVETTYAPSAHGGWLTVVIGFGLNVVKAPVLDRAVTSLADHHAGGNSEIVLAALAECSETWLDRWDEGRGFADIRSAWLERGGPAGEPVSVNTGSGRVAGTYQGLSDTGGLVLDVEGSRQEFNFGDVALGM